VDAPPQLIEFENLIRLLTFVGAGIAAWAALTQARIARQRHEEQTKADLQRRITESFTKAVEQLGSDKLQVRLGGIYTLERISRESELDYWPIMETLTAFVRERAPWRDRNPAVSQTVARIYQDDTPQQFHPPTDIAAVLTVIMRRDAQSREREPSENWLLDLGSTDLRGASLIGAHLENARFYRAHLEEAFLAEAHLKGAYLVEAHLEGAHLVEAHLEEANLIGAHLEGAFLSRTHLEGAQLMLAHLDEARLVDTHLEGARLMQAHLEGAFLIRAHLEGADLEGVTGLKQEQLDRAYGNAETRLPEGMTRPAHWLSG
jgi:hypothetical protein